MRTITFLMSLRAILMPGSIVTKVLALLGLDLLRQVCVGRAIQYGHCGNGVTMAPLTNDHR